MFRLVLTDNPLVSPFPSHRWLTKEDAERFSSDPDAAREFAGKLTVVEESDAGPGVIGGHDVVPESTEPREA